MEVKINKEIQSHYSESMSFGLSMRQCGFSLAAMLVAVGCTFCFEALCGHGNRQLDVILGAAPFAAMPFINYHGMTAEQLAWAWIKTPELLNQSGLFVSLMISHYKLLEDTISNHEREAYKIDRNPFALPG